MRLAKPGSDWAFPMPDSFRLPLPDSLLIRNEPGLFPQVITLPLPHTLPIRYNQTEYVAKLDNVEYGFKLNGFSFGFDWSLIYLKVRDDKPVFQKAVDSSTVYMGFQLPYSFSFTEIHPWQNIYGVNFSTSLGSFVIRGEGGFFKNKRFDYALDFPTILPMDTLDISSALTIAARMESISRTGLLMKKDFLQYMLGFDYPLTSSVNLSTQFIHQHIFDYEPSIISDEDVFIGTLLLRGHYFNDTFFPAALIIYNQTSKSSVSRFWMDWNPADAFTITLGLDIIGGNEGDFFGNFDGNDNMYLKVKYSF
jgi:hypothetical protein